ncbi:MAG TPA: hypothetical protein VNI36_08135 [Candidatus Dormibacteraeota bacterium]|nr:hypothetical protein [Candidatus Dormibacteraeota bacterium]
MILMIVLIPRLTQMSHEVDFIRSTGDTMPKKKKSSSKAGKSKAKKKPAKKAAKKKK